MVGRDHTKESLSVIALKFKSRGEFQLKDSAAYGIARKSGILDDICKHMITASYSTCLLYTSPSPRDRQKSRMPSSA